MNNGTNKKIVKISINSPIEGLLRQTPNNDGIWGDYKFEINNNIEECDYWFVYSKGYEKLEECFVSPSNIFLITGEPENVYHYAKGFIKQFSTVFTTRNDIKTANLIKMHPAQPWWLGRLNGFDASGESCFPLKFNDISAPAPKKTKLISVISSNKSFSAGHKERLKFVAKLKEYFGDQLDVYGRGINDFNDKWEVLKDYKYHIVIENSSHHHYWTEKLADCFLAECFPFYHGAPNIDAYFDEKSYSYLDINDVEKSIKTIETAIKNNTYEQRISQVVSSKQKVLYEYNIFNEIIKICDMHNSELPKESIKIKNEKSYIDLHKIPLLVSRFLNKWRIINERT